MSYKSQEDLIFILSYLTTTTHCMQESMYK